MLFGADLRQDAAATGTHRHNVLRVLSSSGLSAAIGAPLALLTVPLVLGRLTVTAYGAYATLASLLAIAALVEGGIATEVTRRVAAARAGNDESALRAAVREGTTILMGPAAVALIVGLLAATVGQKLIFGALPEHLADQLSGVTVVVAATMALDLVISGWTATLIGLQRADIGNYAGLAGLLAGTCLSVGLVLDGHGIWSLAIGAMAQTAVSSAIRAAGMRRLAPSVPFRIGRTSTRQMRAYSATSSIVLIASLSNVIDFQFDKILLANIVGVAAAGTYAVGSSLALQARALSLLPVGLLIPGTIELGEGEKLARIRRAVTQLNTASALTLTGGVVVFAPTFIRLWVGNQYETAAFTAQLLAVALLLNSLTGPLYSHCVAQGLFTIPLYSALTNIMVNGSASWLLISHIGFRGAALGSLLGNAAGSGCFLILLQRTSQRSWGQGLTKPTMFVAAVAVLALRLTSWHTLGWVAFLAGGAAWVLVCGLVFLAANWLPIRLRRQGRHGLSLTLS